MSEPHTSGRFTKTFNLLEQWSEFKGAVYLYEFYTELGVFGAVPVRKKNEILGLKAGFIVLPGLPLALLFFARALIGRTDGA